MVARNSDHLEEIMIDDRVKEAMEIGLSVVDLSSNSVCWTTEKEVRNNLFSHCKSARLVPSTCNIESFVLRITLETAGFSIN